MDPQNWRPGWQKWGMEWWWMDLPNFRPWILEFQGLKFLRDCPSNQQKKGFDWKFQALKSTFQGLKFGDSIPYPTFCPLSVCWFPCILATVRRTEPLRSGDPIWPEFDPIMTPNRPKWSKLGRLLVKVGSQRGPRSGRADWGFVGRQDVGYGVTGGGWMR